MTVADLAARLSATFRSRAALGLRPLPAPVMLFVPLGALLGPRVSGVLSQAALAHLDIVISIALATLGVFIGIAAGREGRQANHLFLASTIEAGVTILVVGGAVFALLRIWQLPLDMSLVLAALAMGVCASASAAPSAEAGDEHVRHLAVRVADLDDVLPILLGGYVLTAVTVGRTPLLDAGLTIGLGLAIGVCGWLLVERASGVAERGVFVLGALALLGGAPAYLGLSPLVAGMAAGFFWVVAPEHCDTVVARELRKVQHPLIVLLLLIAGASLVVTTAGIWLLVPYVVFRFLGKMLGGWVAGRLVPSVALSDLGAYLMQPGVIGIAFALNLQQVAGDAATPLVFAVAIGAIACEALAIVVLPPSGSS